jgi:hypothetical protein
VKRQEAVELLNELLAYCKQLNPRLISLHPSKQADDFEIHIKDHVADADCENLKRIVQKRGLSIKEHNDFWVIYTPKPDENS